MPTDLQASRAPIGEKGGFRLTGVHVFIILCCFFGVILAVDLTMAGLALKTFRGQVSDHPYESGLKYNNDIAAARAQAERGWKVEGAFAPLADGQARLDFQMRDKSGSPISGLEIQATLEAPADRNRDRVLTVVETNPGVYVAQGPAEAGVWNLVLMGRRDNEILYQTRNRMILK